MPSRTPPTNRPRSGQSPRPDGGSDDVDQGLFGAGEPAARRWGEALRKACLGSAAALMVARPLWPGEDAPEGSGLAWVLLLLTTFLLAGAASWLAGGVRLRISWPDAAIAGLTCLVGASTAVAADRRAAINMAWEWAGFGVAYFLLRNLPRDRRESTVLAAVLVTTATALAAYGLYQVAVEYPQTRAEYRAHPERVLRELGIDPNSNSRRAFEDRLLGSREVMATFALANSLAGFLVGPTVVLLAAVLMAVAGRPGEPRRFRPVVLAVPPLLLLLTCLLLTKSRSAYAGLGAGLAVAAWQHRGRVGRRTLALTLGAFLATLLALTIAAAATGQLDRQVLTESTKSLRYRWEYWQGAWALINASSRTFAGGVGPGNFAGPYLRYKLPTSSEEITDPHNLVLDVWASSGAAAAGLLVLAIGLVLRETLGKPREPSAGDEATPSEPFWIWPAAWGGWFLVVLLERLNPFTPDGLPRWLILGMSWIVTALMVGPLLTRGRRLDGAMLGAGFLAVTVNLLGAGGIAIPPVALALWGLAALGQNLRDDRPCSRVRLRGDRWWALGWGLAASAVIGAFCGAILPHWFARRAVEQAREHLGPMRFDYSAAREAYLRAARADRLWPQPWKELAELEYRQWQASGAPATPQVGAKIATVLVRAVRPPYNPRNLSVQRLRIGYDRRLLQQLESRVDPARLEPIRRDLLIAAAEAVRLYPTLAELRAELAEAAAFNGRHDVAAREAREALRLDALTPHTDKKLADPVRAKLIAALPEWDKAASPEPR